MDKKIGKIKSVNFGHVGYQNAMFGIQFSLGGDGWGVYSDNCTWDSEKIKCTEHSQWTEEERSKQYADIMRYISKILKDAKVSEISDLKNIPVEVTFEGMSLKSFRILTEVL